VLALTALAVVRFGLQLQLGPEFDSNANRAEIVAGAINPVAPISSFLLRTTARGQLGWARGKNLLKLSFALGGKVYFNSSVFDQDVLVAQASVDDRVTLSRHWSLATSADYYEAAQLPVAPMDHHDFRTGSALERLQLVGAPGTLSLAGGYRGFQYKPDGTASFQGWQTALALAGRRQLGPPDGGHELDLTAAYHLEQRFFAGPSLLNPTLCTMGMACVGDPRRDWYQELNAELTYLGPLLVAAGYALQLNRSNSFASSLLRHVITLKIAYRLPWSLYATAKAQLLVTHYFDPIDLARSAIDPGVLIALEDENRNALIVDLERPVGHGLAVEARYSFFTNELGQSTVSYQRHVAYLGLAYRYSR
jgi:hypothetical protein